MTKLHEVFSKPNNLVDHGQTIKQMVEQGSNINERDENGNTVLHLMMIHLYDNYFNPFFEKSNPTGKFNSSTGYSGHFHYTNYKGPAVLDDLESLLMLGADPTLKNNKNQTFFELMLASNHLGYGHINQVFILILDPRVFKFEN